MKRPERILITGATGCAGRHLSRLALASGARVFGFARRDAFAPGVAGIVGSIADPDAVAACLAESRPDWIFHLAALVHGAGDHKPEELNRVNVDGTRHLLSAALRLAPAARILVAGSSGIYGRVENPAVPIDERAPLRPGSPYARSKAEQDRLSADFAEKHGLQLVRVRLFNQTGPGEPAGLVCASLARQVARIETGAAEPVLRVLHLGTSRDFCDVRDVVAGYWAALERGEPGRAYNLCSGRARTIGEIVRLLLARTLTPGIAVVETHPEPSADAILHQVGDSGLLRRHTGWTPRISLEQSLGDLLDEWREKTRTPS